LEFLNSEPYYASKKLLSSCQIFRYAVPARTVTKKALEESQYAMKAQVGGVAEWSAEFVA